MKTISANAKSDESVFLLVTLSHKIMLYDHITANGLFEIIFERPDAEFRGFLQFLLF